MSEIEVRLAALEKEMAAMKALSQARASQEQERSARDLRIEEKVDALLRAEHARQGREQAHELAQDRRGEDRHERNQWMRSLLPTGLFVGIWTAILWVFDQIGNAQ